MAMSRRSSNPTTCSVLETLLPNKKLGTQHVYGGSVTSRSLRSRGWLGHSPHSLTMLPPISVIWRHTFIFLVMMFCLPFLFRTSSVISCRCSVPYFSLTSSFHFLVLTSDQHRRATITLGTPS